LTFEELEEEIAVELEAIDATVDELLSIQRDVADRKPTVREKTAAAAFLAQFYNGVENILKRLSYIHLNPIRTSRFKDADYARKADYLKKYPWSTFAGYCYLRKRNKNIDYGWFLSTYFGEDTAKGRRQCREYVYRAIEGEIENPFEEVVHQSILGTQDFVDWVRQKLPRRRQREVPSLTKLQQHISVERIIEVVAKAGNAEVDDLRDRKTKLKDLRQMAMEISYRYSNYKQKEIGAIFGVDYSTVSQNRVRLKAKLKSSRKLRKQFHRLLEQIDKLSNTKIRLPYFDRQMFL
jgi:hypothetical protein